MLSTVVCSINVPDIIFYYGNEKNLGCKIWSFEKYLTSTYFIPFDFVFRLNTPYLNYIIDFDDIKNGFNYVLEECEIQQKRILPTYNKTGKKDIYYNISGNLKMKIFGPYLKSIRRISRNQEIYKISAFRLLLFYIFKYYKNYKWMNRDQYRSNTNDEYFGKLNT